MPPAADERFHTPRNSARRGGYASSEDERYTTPRGGHNSARSMQSENEFITPRSVGSSATYSSDEQEGFYSGRDDLHQNYPDYREKQYQYEDTATGSDAYYYQYSAQDHVEYTQDGYYSEYQQPAYNYSQYDQGYQYEEEYREAETCETEIADVFSLARHNKVLHVEELLDEGVPVNVKDAYGNTILSIACQNGLKKMAKCVLRRGADINSQNYMGNTPLHFCFEYGYGDTLGSYLISKGADSTIRNSEGYTCFDGTGRARK